LPHARTAIVAIGDGTARAASAEGLVPSIVAARPNYDGILEALAAVLKEPK
jgi:uroporphyrinogen-III synthase